MSNIKELCENVSFNNLSSWRNITSKKLNNAKAYLRINEEVILFYDSTAFGSGKTGLAICESGIYWRDMMSSSRYLTWEAIRKLKLTYNKNNLYFGNQGSIVTISESDAINLGNTINKIRINVKIENFAEKTSGLFNFVKGAIDFINDLTEENNTNNIETNNKQNLLDDGSNNQYINKNVTASQVIEVPCESQERVIDNGLIEQVKEVKEILKYLNREYIESIIREVDKQIENKEQFQDSITFVTMSILTLSNDEELLESMDFDQETKELMNQLKVELNPQVELVENVFNKNVGYLIGKENISIRNAINLCNHRVKVILEDYDDGEDIIELHERTLNALKDFRKKLKEMIKYCNLLIEQLYVQS